MYSNETAGGKKFLIQIELKSKGWSCIITIYRLNTRWKSMCQTACSLIGNFVTPTQLKSFILFVSVLHNTLQGNRIYDQM